MDLNYRRMGLEAFAASWGAVKLYEESPSLSDYSVKSHALIKSTIATDEKFGWYDHSTPEDSFDPDRPTWFVNELDGADNASRDIPLSSISIGLWDDGAAKIGVVQTIGARATYRCVTGDATMKLDGPCHVTRRTHMVGALIGVDMPIVFKGSGLDVATTSMILRLTIANTRVRILGCTSLALAMVASGELDGYVNLDAHPANVVAGAALVAGSRGTVVDFLGNPWTPASKVVVATSHRLRDYLLSMIPTDLEKESA